MSDLIGPFEQAVLLALIQQAKMPTDARSSTKFSDE
jgi:hypothetical protein